MSPRHQTMSELLQTLTAELAPILAYAESRAEWHLAESECMTRAHEKLRESLFWLREHERLYGEFSGKPTQICGEDLASRARERLVNLIGNSQPMNVELDPLVHLATLGFAPKLVELEKDAQGNDVVPEGHVLVAFEKASPPDEPVVE